MKSQTVTAALASFLLVASSVASPATQAEPSPAPYDVRLSTDTNGVRGLLRYGNRDQSASRSTRYAGETQPFPDAVVVEWSYMGVWNNKGPTQHWRATLPVKSVVPKDFSRGDQIDVVVRGDGIAYIEFRVGNAPYPRVGDRHGPSSIEKLPDTPCEPLSSSDKECAAPDPAYQRRIRQPPPLDVQQQTKDEALFQALKARDLEAFKRALVSGADPHQEWRSIADWPIQEIVQSGWVEAVDVLAAAKITLHGNLLHVPIVKDHMGLLDALLRAGMRPDYTAPTCPRPQTESGLRNCRHNEPPNPVIFSAIYHNEPEMVQLLLKYGATLDFNVNNETPVREWVRQHGSPEMQRVIAAGPRPYGGAK